MENSLVILDIALILWGGNLDLLVQKLVCSVFYVKSPGTRTKARKHFSHFFDNKIEMQTTRMTFRKI